MIENEYNPTETTVAPLPQKPSKVFRVLMLLVVLCALAGAALCIALWTLNTPPKDFTSPTMVTIEKGSTVKEITQQLEESGVVRSGTLLYFVVSLFYDPTRVKASTYIFDEPLSTTDIADRLVAGDFDTDLIRFTHFEGERATEIAAQAKTQLENFDEAIFLARAVPLEGTLYPETYYIPKNFTADELVDLMIKTFAEKTAPLQQKIENHSLSREEVLILASILEREANTLESMKIISGILQGRMAINMPLQADASIEYILNKPLKELTAEDLKVDSPYNTYTNRGLPPTPIGNPGLDAIIAVLEPTKTNFVYYITDDEGVFHYAETYDQHLDNVNLYLR